MPGAIFLASSPTGTDELGRSTRARVEALSVALAEAGYEPRLGGIPPPPGSVPTPRGGVQVAILCLTQTYMKMSDPARRAEFETLVAALGRDRLLAVALEPCCAKPIPPPGPVGSVLHGLNPADLSAADGSPPYALGLAELVADIVALSGAGRVQLSAAARQLSQEPPVPPPEPPPLRSTPSRSTAGQAAAQAARDAAAHSPAATPSPAVRSGDARRSTLPALTQISPERAAAAAAAAAAEAVVVIAAANRKPSEVKAAQSEGKAAHAALASPPPAASAALASPSPAQSERSSPLPSSRRPSASWRDAPSASAVDPQLGIVRPSEIRASTSWRDAPSAAAVDPQLGIVRPSEIRAGVLLGRGAPPGSPAASQPSASGLPSSIDARSCGSPAPALGLLSPRSRRDSSSSRSGLSRRPAHLTVPIVELSVEELCTLLNNLGFARYTPAIAAAGLDGAQICGATHASLEALGVHLLHRRAILGRVEGFVAAGVPALLLDENAEPVLHPHDCMLAEGDLPDAAAEEALAAANARGPWIGILDQQIRTLER